MAYRRRQGGTPKSATFREERHNDSDDDDQKKWDHQRSISFGNDPGSLAARAIRASAAHRDSSGFGSAYASGDHSPSPTSSSASSSNYFRHHDRDSSHHFRSKRSFVSQSNSNKDGDDPRYGFWGILAQKAKSILDEDDRFDSSNRMKSQINETGSQFYRSRQFSESSPKVDNARLRKGFDGIKSSLNNFGDAFGDAFEEGRTMVKHRTPDLIRETSNKTADIRLQMRRRGGGSSDTQDQASVLQNTSWQRPTIQPVQVNPLANQETQLKASRDVAMATAAKAKVLLRELKTVKADLAFAKERCSQLEEENKRLRESREKGDNPDDDDDLIRLQLETLLAEKARLAHENSVYARENRFLREIVEYHQLTMQEVVYLDEGAEEVTEVYPFSIDDARVLSSTPTSPISPYYLPEDSSLDIPPEAKEHTTDTDEVCSLGTSLPHPSSLPEVCGSRRLPEKTESSKVITPSLKVVDKEIEASHNTQPQIAIAEDPKRPAVSAA